jgi:hypothetical protein
MLTQEYKHWSDLFLSKDTHLWFFLENSLKETIKVGTDWMIDTSPWADIMDNPQWPTDIKNSSKKGVQTPIMDAVNEEDSSDDDDMTDIDELDDDHVEFSISDVEVEEDEVDHLVNIME